MPAPTALDSRFINWCRTLYAGAIDRNQYEPAWEALAELLGACSVQLRRNLRAPVEGLTPECPVRAFAPDVAHGCLARALADAGAAHGVCAFIRPGDSGIDAVLLLRREVPFSAEECAWIELLAGHIRASLDLADRLDSPLPTTAHAARFTRLLPGPCILTDEAGRCIERNEAFDRLLDGLSGSVRSGRIAFADQALQRSWQQALHEAHATALTQSFVASAPTAGRWKAHAVPFESVTTLAEDPRPFVFAVFEPAGAPASQAAALSPSRPLTKAELEVLASLLLGQTAKAIARTRGASVHTVRSQITAILGKTGHHTQKQLIASFNGNSSDWLPSGHGAQAGP